MKSRTLLVIVVFAVAIIFFAAQIVYAAASSWSQNDWRGGSGQITWSDSTKYYSTSSVSVSASGIALSTTTGWYI